MSNIQYAEMNTDNKMNISVIFYLVCTKRQIICWKKNHFLHLTKMIQQHCNHANGLIKILQLAYINISLLFGLFSIVWQFQQQIYFGNDGLVSNIFVTHKDSHLILNGKSNFKWRQRVYKADSFDCYTAVV